MEPALEKIYVHAIDGTDVWIPFTAEVLGSKGYRLLQNQEFDPGDPTVIFEFIPGDIVVGQFEHFPNGQSFKVACALIEPSTHPDKRYLDFLYKVLNNLLPLQQTTSKMYKAELKRVKAEISKGKRFYPTIIEAVINLDKEVGQA